MNKYLSLVLIAVSVVIIVTANKYGWREIILQIPVGNIGNIGGERLFVLSQIVTPVLMCMLGVVCLVCVGINA